MSGSRRAEPSGKPWTSGHILFLTNTDYFFLSDTLPLARRAKELGLRVSVCTADTGRGIEIEEAGFHFVPWPVSRSGTNPLTEFRSLMNLKKILKALQPDLVHRVTPKAVLYGALAEQSLLRFFPFLKRGRTRAAVNTISGLGWAFSEGDRAKLLRALIRLMYRFALHAPRSKTIFQNSDDRSFFLENGFVNAKQSELVRGSGVDCEEFRPLREDEISKRQADFGRQSLVLLPARMLKDKGVREFVEAARLLKSQDRAIQTRMWGAEAKTRPEIRMVLAGGIDAGNPATISEQQLKSWVKEGVVEWWGCVQNIRQVMQHCTMVVLPSYREGLPRSLLEASACGRPIIAADVPGCREICLHAKTGLRVPVRDSEALAKAIASLLLDPARAETLGQAGREFVVSECSTSIVVEQVVRIYDELLTIHAGESASSGRMKDSALDLESGAQVN